MKHHEIKISTVIISLYVNFSFSVSRDYESFSEKDSLVKCPPHAHRTKPFLFSFSGFFLVSNEKVSMQYQL